MKIKRQLNIKLGEETKNGRIYPKEYKEEFEKVKYVLLENNNNNSTLIPVSKIFGLCKTKCSDDGSINVEIEVLPKYESLVEHFEKYELTSFGIGTYEADDKTIKDYKANYFYFCLKDEK